VKKIELISFATADELASRVAGAWLDELEKARRAGKPHCVALSGGRITQKFFASVVEQASTRKFGDGGTPSLPGNVHFFWADERCVPPDDPESNFKLANELLFQPLKVPENQIHRIRGEDSPATAVQGAGSELRQIALPGEKSQPVLDLIFLGMGEDGHVASLFPNAPAEVMNDPGPFLFVKDSPKPPPRRVSLNYATIAAAREVWVLVSGAGKEKALRESMDFSGKTPLARVVQIRQNTRIFSEISPK
jgi:6-phosphogluconolactonase